MTDLTALELTLSPLAMRYMRESGDALDWICRAAEQYAKAQERRRWAPQPDRRTYEDRKPDLQVMEKRKLLKRAIETEGTPLRIAQRKLAVAVAELDRAKIKLARATKGGRDAYIERYSKAVEKFTKQVAVCEQTVARLSGRS